LTPIFTIFDFMKYYLLSLLFISSVAMSFGQNATQIKAYKDSVNAALLKQPQISNGANTPIKTDTNGHAAQIAEQMKVRENYIKNRDADAKKKAAEEAALQASMQKKYEDSISIYKASLNRNTTAPVKVEPKEPEVISNETMEMMESDRAASEKANAQTKKVESKKNAKGFIQPNFIVASTFEERQDNNLAVKAAVVNKELIITTFKQQPIGGAKVVKLILLADYNGSIEIMEETRSNMNYFMQNGFFRIMSIPFLETENANNYEFITEFINVSFWTINEKNEIVFLDSNGVELYTLKF
jgi:hypothetical protein